jgi:zinc protease
LAQSARQVVSTNPLNIDKVTTVVMEELHRFLKDGPTDREVADAKQAFVESQKVSRTADAAIAGAIVANLHAGRTFAFTANLENAILALTPSQVADAFRKHVDPERLVIIRAGDFQKRVD